MIPRNCLSAVLDRLASEGGYGAFRGSSHSEWGLHALHITIGIGVIGWLLWRLKKGTIDSERYMGVELMGLYWHFVDLVWVFLFPLFYLVHTR